MKLNVKRLPAGIYAANCYIISSSDNTEAIVVDPGGEVEAIMSHINKAGVSVNGIVLTHGHGDHIGGVLELRKRLNVPVMVHKSELDMVSNSSLNMSASMSMGEITFTPEILLSDGDEISIGDEKLLVIHTPGHTLGGISLYSDGILITGDTLFKGSIGRTDLYGGNHNVLLKSIKNKLLRLEDETIIYPGHGSESTIGFERQRNPFLRG